MENPTVITSEDRTWAALAHASVVLSAIISGIGGIIAAFIIWLVYKEKSRFVAFHALQSLAFQVVTFLIVSVGVGIIWVIGFLFSLLTVGVGAIIAVPVMIVAMFAGIAAGIAAFIYQVYGAVQVLNGDSFRYFWVGDWAARQV